MGQVLGCQLLQDLSVFREHSYAPPVIDSLMQVEKKPKELPEIHLFPLVFISCPTLQARLICVTPSRLVAFHVEWWEGRWVCHLCTYELFISLYSISMLHLCMCLVMHLLIHLLLYRFRYSRYFLVSVRVSVVASCSFLCSQLSSYIVFLPAFQSTCLPVYLSTYLPTGWRRIRQPKQRIHQPTLRQPRFDNQGSTTKVRQLKTAVSSTKVRQPKSWIRQPRGSSTKKVGFVNQKRRIHQPRFVNQGSSTKIRQPKTRIRQPRIRQPKGWIRQPKTADSSTKVRQPKTRIRQPKGWNRPKTADSKVPENF